MVISQLFFRFTKFDKISSPNSHKGEISYELAVRYGIHCTLVDPKPCRLSSMSRNRMKKVTTMRYEGRKESEKLPECLKYRIDDDKVIDDQVWSAIYKDQLPFEHIQKPFVFPFPEDSSKIFHEAMIKSKFVVGCHPGNALFGLFPRHNYSLSLFPSPDKDQPTGDIIDCCLMYKISFAVIPCCVFTNIFPDRYVDGRQVRTYEDLIAYLLAKDPTIQVGYLPFEGRNQVLYKFYPEEMP